MTKKIAGNSKKRNPTPASFKPGKSGNPLGRPKLPEELKLMKEGCLSKVIELMFNTINDDDYIASLKHSERMSLIEVVGDRCGLVRAARSEEGVAVTNDLANTIREVLAEARKHNVILPNVPPAEPRAEYRA